MHPDQVIQAFHLPEPTSVTPLLGGANNRVFKLDFANRPTLVLKQYFQHPNDPRARLPAEFSFLQYAWKTGIRNIPEPLQSSSETNSALYSFLPGRQLQINDLTDKLIEQTISFFLTLNLQKSEAASLPYASEACFSINDYLQITEKRIDRLRNIQSSTALEQDLLAFLDHRMIPKWTILKEKIGKTALHLPLGRENQCVTPSDFGFHNALLNDEKLSFIDFEYAGWDDPCKTVCDLFCQPRIPIPEKYFGAVSETFASVSANPAACLQRIKIIQPVMQMKWCCILLNTFTNVGKDRRTFSHSEELERQEKQLIQAKQLFEKIQI